MRFIKRLSRLLLGLVQSFALRVDPKDNPAVVFDIHSMEHFRPHRWLSIIFQLAGLTVYVKGHFNRRTLHVAHNTKWHANVRLIWHNWLPTDKLILCTDRHDPISSKNYLKYIRLQYDYGPKIPLPDDSHFTIPFTMHAQLYGQYHDHERLDTYRTQTRNIRLLFAGNTNPGYDNASIQDVCGILSRHEIIEHLQKNESIELVSDDSRWQQILTETNQNRSIILKDVRINQKNWLKTMASTQFFLSPPGVLFPITHSAVEAMAVGTIPIVNYPHWFFPNLVDGENCLTFTSLQELDEKITHIAKMDTAQIEKLRQGAIRYYENHLTPNSFVKRLIESPHQTLTLHVLDESPEAVRRAMSH